MARTIIRITTGETAAQLNQLIGFAAKDARLGISALRQFLKDIGLGTRKALVELSVGEDDGVAATGVITPNSTLAEGDTVTIGGTALTWKNGYATGTITCSGVDEDDGFAIGETSFVFKTSADPEVEEEITIGASDALTATAAAAAINAHPVASTLVVATAASAVVNLRAKATGTGGNSIVLTSTDGTDLAVSGAGTLAGGEAVSSSQVAINYGSTAATVDTAASATNLAAAINANTTLNAIVSAAAVSSAVTVSANDKGDIGNQITLAESGSGVDLSGLSSGKLSGGTDLTFISYDLR